MDGAGNSTDAGSNDHRFSRGSDSSSAADFAGGTSSYFLTQSEADHDMRADELDDDSSDDCDGNDFYCEDDEPDAVKQKANDGSKVQKPASKAKNREHAKNTRQRKKNYIESLKDSIQQLESERDKIDRDRKISLSRLAEQTVVRKKVLQTMFYYRATAEMNRTKWELIMEESFTYVMPITPYRSFPPSEVVEGQRYVRGISAVILDSASLNVMLQSIVPPLDSSNSTSGSNSNSNSSDNKITVQFFFGPDESVMSEDSFMCKWQMITTNAVQRGCRYEVSKSGMLKAIFSAQNKLTFMEQTFDVMSFMQQLRRASGKYDFLVIPNTLLLAQEEMADARLIIEATRQHKIVYMNQSWLELFSIAAKEATGKPLSVIFGADTDRDRVAEMTEFVNRKLPYSTIITCYDKQQEPLRNWIRFYPLYSEHEVSHFLCVMEKIVDRFPPRSSYFLDRPVPSTVAITGNKTGKSVGAGDITEVSEPSTMTASTSHSPHHGRTKKDNAAAINHEQYNQQPHQHHQHQHHHQHQQQQQSNVPTRQINSNGMSSMTNSNEADSSSDNSTDNNDGMQGDDCCQDGSGGSNLHTSNADLTDANLHNINASSGGPFPLDAEPFMCVSFGRNFGSTSSSSSSASGSTGSSGSQNGNGGTDSTRSTRSRSSSGSRSKGGHQSNKTHRDELNSSNFESGNSNNNKHRCSSRSKESEQSHFTAANSDATTLPADVSADIADSSNCGSGSRSACFDTATADADAVVDTSIIDPQTGDPVEVASEDAPSGAGSLSEEQQQQPRKQRLDRNELEVGLSDEDDSLDENLLSSY